MLVFFKRGDLALERGYRDVAGTFDKAVHEPINLLFDLEDFSPQRFALRLGNRISQICTKFTRPRCNRSK